MDLVIEQVEDKDKKELISRKILSDLPEWFGLPESTENYIQESKKMPFLACYDKDEVIGFIVLNETSKDCGDIFVMGILKKYHGQGAGRKLYKAFEKMAKELNYTYLQVKTVKKGCYKEYDISNNFYISMGFKELESFPDMWDKWNPCQIYIKYIG